MFALGREHGGRVPAVRPGLLASDEHLCGTVDPIRVGFAGSFLGKKFFEGFDRLTLGTQVGMESFPSAFPSESAFPTPAESGGGVELVGRVDPSHSADDLGGEVEGQVGVFGPNGGGQPVAGIVGQGDGFGRCPKGRAHEDGAENFLLHQAAGRIDFGDEGGR